MTFPRPRSLSSMLVVGLLILVVPLAVAVVRAGTQLGRLAGETDTLVRQGVELSGESQALFRHLSAYERSANLYLLLADPRLLEASRATEQQIVETLDRISTLPLGAAAAGLTDDLRRATRSVIAVLEFGPPDDPGRIPRLTTRLQELSAAADALAGAANESLESRLALLARRVASTRQQLSLGLLALVPIATGLTLIFALGVLRPLRRIDRAIRDLGGGSFSRPIAVQGPSDLEALGRQLEWLRVRLLDLAQEKNRFLRHMSHELKTPLANIREGTDLLLEGAVGPLDENQREVAVILRDNGLQLQRLIENLLSYSAWQTRATQLDLSEFPLSGLVATVADAQRLAIAARELRLDVKVEDLVMTADRGKLKLVLDNLLSNALKFTPRGGTIYVHGRREGQVAVIDFADSGPGIAEADRSRVFEEFYTGTAPQSGPLKGTGIGLSVVREFIEAHGGTVELASGRFPGAHFHIRVPLAAMPTPAERKPRAD